MENLNSESLFPDDEDSHESSTDTTPIRRVPLPASALHGIGHDGAKAPKFEDLFAVEKQRREIIEHHEHHKDDDDEEKASDDSSPTPRGHARIARDLPFHKLTSLEVPEHTAAPEAHAQPAAAESTPAIHPEMTDEEIHQIVEVSLRDLQGLDVAHEPQALDPSVAHAEAVAYRPAAELPRPKPAAGAAEITQPVASAEATNNAADFAAWEAEMAAHEGGAHPSEDNTPAEQAGTGGGGNRPPVPPFGVSGEMPGSYPDPEEEPAAHETAAHGAAPYEKPRSSLMDKLAVPLAAAEMLHINNKIQRAELARMRGDTVVGMVAGWALLRSFRDRNMLRRNKQEIEDQLEQQQKTTQQLAQQNQLIQQQQRIARAQQQQAAQPATPNRFRPGVGTQNMNAVPVLPGTQPNALPAAQQNMNAQPGMAAAQPNQMPAATPNKNANQAKANKNGNVVVAPTAVIAPNLRRNKAGEAATKAEQAEAERIRLAQAQQEEAIRQETLNLPQNHEIVRSSWHSIERDKTTGKVVEKPTSFEYGAALQQELKSEQLQDRMADDAQTTQQAGPGGVAGPGSLVGGAFGLPTPRQRAVGQTVLSNMPPLEQQRAAQKTTAQQIASAPSSPWFWVALIFLLVVFFAAAWF